MEHSDPERRSPYTVRESALVILAPLTLFTEDEIKKCTYRTFPSAKPASW